MQIAQVHARIAPWIITCCSLAYLLFSSLQTANCKLFCVWLHSIWS